MIKESNIFGKDAKGVWHFRCEKCGEEFTRSRYDSRLSPLCGRCWREERKEAIEREKIKDRRKAYIRGWNDAIEAAYNLVKNGFGNDSIKLLEKVREEK